MIKWLALVTVAAVVVVTGAALGFQNDSWVFERGHTPEFPLEKELIPPEEPPTPTTSSPLKDQTVEEESAPPAGGSPKETSESEAEPEDTTPPELVILHPVEGQVFEKKEVAFEGVTEVGARVFAGNYEAQVDDDGSWRIVLILSPGGNHATLRAEDPAGNTAQASVTVYLETPAEEDKATEHPEEEPKEESDQEKPDQPDVRFEAHQVYGECSETPPYDVFYGHGHPGSIIYVISEYGSGETTVNDEGEWEIKVFFEEAPVGKGFAVKVKDEFGNHQLFEFIRTG